MVSYACGYICVYICAARLYKKHNPHAKLPRGILASSIIFPYPRNKGENGSKKVSTASKSSSRSKGKSHEVTYPQNAENSAKKTLLACSAVSSPLRLKPWSSRSRPGGVPCNLDDKKNVIVNLLTSTGKQQNSVHQAIYSSIFSESTVEDACCFFGCHHDQRGCHISDYKVLLRWAVNKTILWEIHSRTHFRIFTAKTYIEMKLCVPISQTGLVFST